MDRESRAKVRIAGQFDFVLRWDFRVTIAADNEHWIMEIFIFMYNACIATLDPFVTSRLIIIRLSLYVL